MALEVIAALVAAINGILAQLLAHRLAMATKRAQAPTPSDIVLRAPGPVPTSVR